MSEFVIDQVSLVADSAVLKFSREVRMMRYYPPAENIVGSVAPC